MIATMLATFFGLGYVRFAPGTLASVAALPLAWLILWNVGPAALLVASAAVFCVGVWSCGAHATRTGGVDPTECVIDEVAGQWLACAFAPPSLAGFVITFALFRFFDITKIWPVSLGERLRNGWGIMTDDMIAGAISSIIVVGLRWQGLV